MSPKEYRECVSVVDGLFDGIHADLTPSLMFDPERGVMTAVVPYWAQHGTLASRVYSVSSPAVFLKLASHLASTTAPEARRAYGRELA